MVGMRVVAFGETVALGGDEVSGDCIGRCLSRVHNEVAERTVIGDAEAATQNGLTAAEHAFSVGRVGEADTGSDVVCVVLNLNDSVWGLVGIGRIDRRIGKRVLRVAEVVVPDAEVDGQIRIELDVVLREDAAAPAVRIDAGAAEGLGSRAGGAELVLEEVTERANTGAALSEGQGALCVQRDDVGLDGATDVEADAEGLTTVGKGDGVLDLVEVFVPTLGEVLVRAEGG